MAVVFAQPRDAARIFRWDREWLLRFGTSAATLRPVQPPFRLGEESAVYAGGAPRRRSYAAIWRDGPVIGVLRVEGLPEEAAVRRLAVLARREQRLMRP